MTHWPHAPPHILNGEGVYMVTAGTYQKNPFFNTEERLSFLLEQLLSLAQEYGWNLHAWAVFSNHYHFIGDSAKDPANLRIWLPRLHQATAAAINAEERMPNRKIWHQFWDSKITIHTSYLARLKYVHQNAVKHGLVDVAAHYRWCSANQFENSARKSFVQSVYSFNTSKIKIFDDF